MKKKYLVSVIALICITMVIVFSCGKSSYTTAPPTTPPPTSGGTAHDISIYGMSFSPSSLTVPVGTAVKWTNNDSYAHTATSNDGSTFDSHTISAGGTYTYMASTPGTFNYHCTIHGVSMAGTLKVTP